MVQSQRASQQAVLFVYEPNSFVPLATVQQGQTYWYQCDQIGAPLELMDAQGRVAWAADYKVWGEAKVWQGLRTGTNGWADRMELRSEGRAQMPALEQPFRFQGQQFDAETGLHYNRFRYYDPVVGRFVSQDPIGLRGGFNIYQYAVNPIAWLDPFGLSGAAGNITGPNIPDGLQTGSSTLEGGRGISNPAVQQAYDNVPKEVRSYYHGSCAEADMLSKSANKKGITSLAGLREMVNGAVMNVWRNDRKMKPMIACSSCAHVKKQLGIGDGCN